MINQCSSAEAKTTLKEVEENLLPGLMSLCGDETTAKNICADLTSRALRKVVVEEQEEEEEDAEELCDCDFSLAFGNNVLLRKTRLSLHRSGSMTSRI